LPLKSRSPVPFWCGVILALTLSAAQAHKLSDSYLTLRATPGRVEGEWHLALRDLEVAVGLDANDDGVITWDELRSRRQAVVAYALSRFQLSADDRTNALKVTEFLVDYHSDGAYAVLRFAVDDARAARTLQLSYHAFFDIDPLHRGLLRLEKPGASRLAVFSPEHTTEQIDLRGSRTGFSFATFVREGVWHIWSGYDHLLFLLALLLPGVLRRTSASWEPVEASRRAFANVFKIVTAFTVAHSITLSLAATGLVRLPPRLVECAIAASVILAALNNLAPFFAERGWLVAFGFGLVHGFGFANALRDLGLRHGELAVTLFGFNLGVELGQLAIVMLFLPVALALRHGLVYQRFILRAGSAAILTVAATWFAERILDVKWLPF
jgi:hypothetical protein